MTGVTRMSSHQEEMKYGTCSFLQLIVSLKIFVLPNLRATRVQLLTLNYQRNSWTKNYANYVLFCWDCFVSELRFSSNLPGQTLDPALESDSRPRCLSCPVLSCWEMSLFGSWRSLINSSIILNETIHRQADVDWNNLQHLYFQLLSVFLMNSI